MPFSLFVLALWFFLYNGSQNMLGWFTVDNKLIGWVGMVFVAVVVYDAVVWARSSHPGWFARRGNPNA